METAPPDKSLLDKANLDIRDILKILPHRYPLLLVDKILSIDIEGGHIVGLKNVTINENFFQGHFPDVPLMPGVLILEALAQTGGVLIHLKYCTAAKLAVLLTVNNAKFRMPVKPGDTLHLHGTAIHLTSKGGKVKVEAKVENKTVAEAEIGFALVDRNQI